MLASNSDMKRDGNILLIFFKSSWLTHIATWRSGYFCCRRFLRNDNAYESDAISAAGLCLNEVVPRNNEVGPQQESCCLLRPLADGPAIYGHKLLPLMMWKKHTKTTGFGVLRFMTSIGAWLFPHLEQVGFFNRAIIHRKKFVVHCWRLTNDCNI